TSVAEMTWFGTTSASWSNHHRLSWVSTFPLSGTSVGKTTSKAETRSEATRMRSSPSAYTSRTLPEWSSSMRLTLQGRGGPELELHGHRAQHGGRLFVRWPGRELRQAHLEDQHRAVVQADERVVRDAELVPRPGRPDAVAMDREDRVLAGEPGVEDAG